MWRIRRFPVRGSLRSGTIGRAGILSLVVCLAVSGCRGRGEQPDAPDTDRLLATPAAPRNVVLITVDTLRHDATGFSGAGRALTPAIDRIAGQGRVFSFAHAHAVVTLPSHASMLTGLFPYRHGIRDNAGFTLPPGIDTLAEAFRERGYATGAFVSAYTLDRRFGLDRGFDVYDDRYDGFGPRGFSPPERPGAETVAAALAWWRRAPAPKLLWVHLFTPHYPYEPPEPFASRHPAAPYWGEAEAVDAELAPLIDELLDPPGSEAVVVFTSDHGEALGEHGERTHGLFAYEPTLRVPLVVRAPGLVEPGVSGSPAGHVDLLPTLLHLTAGEIPDGLDGRSLFDGRAEGRSSYFEALSSWLNRGWAPLYGRIEGRTKAIDLPLPELYDLDGDPGETANLAEDRGAELGRMLARIPGEARAAVARAAPDAATIERLRSLGYAASRTGPPQTAPGPEADPKRLVSLDRILDEALALHRAGKLEDAIARIERLLERQPGMALAYSHLAFFLTDVGRLEEAERVLGRALESGADNESIRRKLALILARRNRAAEAWDVLAPHAASDDPETQVALGRIAAGRGDPSGARARFERALRLDPTFPQALVDLGLLEMMSGRFESARPRIEEALRQDPWLAEGWNALGAIRSKAGETAGALEAWRRAIEADPRLPDALYNLGLALANGDRAAEAIGYLERYAALVRGRERAEVETLLRRLRAPAG